MIKGSRLAETKSKTKLTTMFSLLFEGGFAYMLPLAIMLVLNLVFIALSFMAKMSKKEIQPIWLEFIKQVGLLAFVWGVFGTMVGLYEAFSDLSQMTEALPFPVIMGGLKVALITALFGSIIFVISMLAYLWLRWMTKKS